MFRGGCGHCSERRPDVDIGGSLYRAMIRLGRAETSRIFAGLEDGVVSDAVEECRTSHDEETPKVPVMGKAFGHAEPARGRVRWKSIVLMPLLELQLAIRMLIMARGALEAFSECRLFGRWESRSYVKEKGCCISPHLTYWR
jgi:hypothetical protein